MQYQRFQRVSKPIFRYLYILFLAGVSDVSHAFESVMTFAPAKYSLATADKGERRFDRQSTNTYTAGYEMVFDTGGLTIFQTGNSAEVPDAR